jgi:hypothetical protein
LAKQKNKPKKQRSEMTAVQDVFEALEPLNPSQRGRVLASVQALLDIPGAGLLESAAEDSQARQSNGRAAKPKSSNRKSANRKSTNRKSSNRKSTARSGSKKSSRRKKATSRR